MKEKTCYYCGTKYPEEEACCPLCGQTETVAEEIDEIPADLKPSAQQKPQPEEEPEYRPRKRKKRKNVFASLLCVVLALAVIACAYWILKTTGLLALLRKSPAGGQTKDASLSWQDDKQPSESTEAATVAETTQPAPESEPPDETTVQPKTETEVQPEESTPGESAGETAGESAESFSLNREDFTLFSVGEEYKFPVSGVPEGAEVVWVSKDESVATVNDGVVKAVGNGSTTVSATCNGVTRTCTVRCRITAGSEAVITETADGVYINRTDFSLLRPDETFKLCLMSGSSEVSGVSWSTGNAAVCTIDSDGTVHAVSVGDTYVIGAYNGTNYRCIVRCKF